MADVGSEDDGSIAACLVFKKQMGGGENGGFAEKDAVEINIIVCAIVDCYSGDAVVRVATVLVFSELLYLINPTV